MDKKNAKNAKGTGKSTEKKPKAKSEVKVNQKEKDFQRLEEYLNESGLSLAFNIIFAELISKQIVRENYFTYTAMRLTQIGKEIEGLKTKEIIYVDDKEEEKKEGDNIEEKAEQTDLQPPVAEENKEEIFMTNPPQKTKEKENENKKENEKEKEKEKKSEVKSNNTKKKKKINKYLMRSCIYSFIKLDFYNFK